MAEFKLDYTAKEINKKLGKIDSLVATVNGAAPDANGNVEVAAGGGIIDVVELPTENIDTSAFYRLVMAYLVWNQETQDSLVVHCVETLPEVGEPAINATQDAGNVYYNLTDGEAYGYVDDMVSAGIGVPAGWYPGATLLTALGLEYKGVITDIEDDLCDDALRILLRKEFYIYQDEWCKLPFACEKNPAFNIQWDGDMTDRLALDMSLLGYANTYFVKVSDNVFTTD